MTTSSLVVYSRPWSRLAALRQQVAQARSARRARKSRAVAVGRPSRSPLRGRVLRRHRDCLLRLVGARGRLARSPRVGRHRCRWSRGSSASGRSSTACSTSTGSTAASTKPAKSFPPAAACWRACRAAACKTTCAFLLWPSSRWPQFFSGAAGHERDDDRISDLDAPHRAAARRCGHRALLRPARARRGRVHHAGLPRRVALHLDAPARRRKHRPRGTRCLGAIARHRVSPRRRRPGRADAGALSHRHAHVGRCGASRAPHARPLLRPCAHARSRPLRLLHRAQFLPLVFVLGAQPHPRLLPHQAVGRTQARPRGHAVLHLHHGRLGGAPALLPRDLSLHRHHGLRATDRDGANRRAGAGRHGSSWPGHALARHRRARRLRGQSAAHALPHLAARGIR